MLVLRPYQDQDWKAICHIHDRARIDELTGSVSLDAFLSLEQAYETEGLFDGEVYVACDNEEVLGFVAYTDDELTWLYVDPAHYRKGIGRELLRFAVNSAGPIVECEVLTGNKAALALYLSEGFVIKKTVMGSLEGNETYPAEGHILEFVKESQD